MLTKKLVLLSLSIAVFTLKCASVPEMIGSSVDPDYNRYIQNRTYEEQKVDRDRQEREMMKYNANKKTEHTMKELNSKKIEAPKENISQNDSLVP